MSAPLTFPILLERFFTERLIQQKHVSPHTIASYRDTFCLLLRYAQIGLHKGPSQRTWPDLDAALIAAFLDDLQARRGTSARSRNVRLAAIHSFFRDAALEVPEHSGLIERVLAIPSKRDERAPIAYLTRVESEALLAAPDLSTWLGRRDRTLLLVALQTGLRVSELIGLRWQDVTLETGAHVRCLGKGRKQRCTPLRKEAVSALRTWQREQAQGSSTIVFPSTRGGALSRDAVADLLRKHLEQARQQCPSLVDKDIHPHGLRHSAAMALLHSGVDCAVIAMWLGHESMETTQIDLHASLEIKQQALDRTTPLSDAHGRYRPDDTLLAFLKSL
jgi:site-specific recombinase XerD